MKGVGKIGAIEIGRVLDSHLLGFTMQAWFPDFDRELVRPHEHWLCPTHMHAETGHFRMPVHSWLLRVNGYTVLIDTCNGNAKHRPGSEMHRLETRYLARMAEIGVMPEDVDFVLCTHLHIDHVGWNTTLQNGKWVPTFPNAQYVFSRTEYEAAQAQAGQSNGSPLLRQIFEDSVHPVVAAGKALLVDEVYELLGALTLRPAPGHSKGHVRIELRSDGETAVFAGDLVHSPIQIPLWE